MSREPYRVVCTTCRVRGSSKPLTVHEWCTHCAQATAHAHRVLGHTVEIVAPKVSKFERESSTVRRLTGGRA